MKKVNRYFLLLISLSLSCLYQSCEKRGVDLALTSGTKGVWEWVRTTTPTRTLTPQSLGYTKQMAVLSDNASIPYVAFYRNDTLQHRLNETSRDTNHTFIDTERSTVLIQYGGAGFLKYYIATNTNGETLTISELLNPYTSLADTVRSVYKRVNKPLYPY